MGESEDGGNQEVMSTHPHGSLTTAAQPGPARGNVLPVPKRTRTTTGPSNEHLTLIAWAIGAWVLLVLVGVVTLLS